jgi:hypothetical protein
MTWLGPAREHLKTNTQNVWTPKAAQDAAAEHRHPNEVCVLVTFVKSPIVRALEAHELAQASTPTMGNHRGGSHR